MKYVLIAIAMGASLIISAQQKTPVYLDVNKPIEERVENALSLMTPEEKVARFLCWKARLLLRAFFIPFW